MMDVLKKKKKSFSKKKVFAPKPANFRKVLRVFQNRESFKLIFLLACYLSNQKIVLSMAEDKASRNVGFVAKAQNFNMCPRRRLRDQGRPLGLHLWN